MARFMSFVSPANETKDINDTKRVESGERRAVCGERE